MKQSIEKIVEREIEKDPIDFLKRESFADFGAGTGGQPKKHHTK